MAQRKNGHRKRSIMKKNTISIYQLFPYEKIEHGEEIILYGFGKIGKRYLAQIEETGYCKVKYIIDQNAEAYQDFRIPVHTVDFLKNGEKAPVVVSVYSPQSRRDIINSVKKQGIPEEQIIIGTHRVAVEEGMEGNLDLVQLVYVSEEEARRKFGDKFLDFWGNLKEKLKIQRILEKPLIRMGKEDDGGYIMVEDFKLGGIAYSFGIGGDVSWDMDLAKRGYDVFMYDHTIEALPCKHKRFHFRKKGIADSADISKDLHSLEYYLKENGHENQSGMILKMDVEGAEIGFLRLVEQDTLKKFDQIIMELHRLESEKYWDQILLAVEKLNTTHSLFHIHANNHANVVWVEKKPCPGLLELSFVKKGIYRMEPAEELMLPLEIDRACLKELPDISMNGWNDTWETRV